MTTDKSRILEFLDRVYDLLVIKANARENDRSTFIHYHFEDNSGIRHYEYRFCGKFGAGGKYRAHSNKVTYYRENETPELNALEAELNAGLAKLAEQYRDVKF